MRRQKRRIAKNGIELVVVTFENAENAKHYQTEVGLEWPIVVDESRELYGYYGMAKASLWDLWGFPTWKVYFQEMMKGNMPKLARGDTYQRGGDVLIDPAGMVRIHRISRGPADRPAIDAILGLVERENSGLSSLSHFENLKN